jgi:hypothetical protein
MVTYREKSNRQMSSFEKAYKWRRMSVFDGVDLKERWNAKIRDMVDEPLLKREPSGECTDLKDDSCRSNYWKVENLLELTRLVGALQNQNPRCLLWFRGERKWYPNATPSACRKKGNKWNKFLAMTKWFNHNAGEGRLFSNRGKLARWAILQHYGAPTPLLDVTTSLRIATAIALWEIDKNKDELKWGNNKDLEPHLSVFATPRPLDGINIFAEIGLCLVDLVAELPSHCLRPHAQRAGFLGLTDIVMDGLDPHEEKPSVEEASLDCVRIARICIPKAKSDDFEKPKIKHVFPPASQYTTISRKKGIRIKRDDMSGDYLLCALHDLNKLSESSEPCPLKKEFPNYYW